MDVISETFKSEVLKGKTFAIISHPDAGKTTLTEKLLLYAGLLRTAGMVRGRKDTKHASADWMTMEQERGISISASVMQFPYKNYLLNVLDTPGHQDFSEDTYRTITAADAAIMVIDASKGVEEQTKKLFKVCRMRNIPIITFINKVDLPAKDLFSLLEEVEQVLEISSVPFNWPIGVGGEFSGVVSLKDKSCQLFERKTEKSGSYVLDKIECNLAEVTNYGVSLDLLKNTEDELFLLAEAGNSFDNKKFLEGQLTPVFFGSALNNYGIEYFYDNFVALAPSPRVVEGVSRIDGQSCLIDPYSNNFLAYVFKIQANMNRKHRDSMAFLRICSGYFTRDMNVYNHTTGAKVRLSRSYSMIAANRDTVDEGYPGDIIGVVNQGFSIGDTLSAENSGFNIKPMPQFPPEMVAEITLRDVMRLKSFEKGMQQLTSEGAVSVVMPKNNPNARWISAVGKLQFEVLEYRLKDEYNVPVELRFLPYKYGVYIRGDTKSLNLSSSSAVATDKKGNIVLLYTHSWEFNLIKERNPDHKFEQFLG